MAARIIAALARAYPAVTAAIEDRLAGRATSAADAKPVTQAAAGCCGSTGGKPAARESLQSRAATAGRYANCCDECCPGCCENSEECCPDCCNETKAAEKATRVDAGPLCCGTTPEPCCGRTPKTDAATPRSSTACCGG
jgi:hypothetical protein